MGKREEKNDHRYTGDSASEVFDGEGHAECRIGVHLMGVHWIRVHCIYVIILSYKLAFTYGDLVKIYLIP